jgi:hypothetical protein
MSPMPPDAIAMVKPAPESTIRFSGLKKLHSDIYIFCMQTELNLQKWNALDLSQWQFYLLTREEVQAHTNGLIPAKSISLRALREHHKPLSAAELQQQGRGLIQRVAGAV